MNKFKFLKCSIKYLLYICLFTINTSAKVSLDSLQVQSENLNKYDYDTLNDNPLAPRAAPNRILPPPSTYPSIVGVDNGEDANRNQRNVASIDSTNKSKNKSHRNSKHLVPPVATLPPMPASSASRVQPFMTIICYDRFGRSYLPKDPYYNTCLENTNLNFSQHPQLNSTSRGSALILGTGISLD